MGKYVLDEPATDTILVKGIPQDATEDDLRNGFKGYGKVVNAVTATGQDYGTVQFSNPVPVDDLMEEDSVELLGKKVQVTRVLAQGQATIAPFKPPDKDLGTGMDTVIVRGACTRTGIALAALCAKSKAMTFCIWERRHKAAEEPNVNASLRKPVYATDEEMGPDLAVISKASETFGDGSLKCAVVHVVSDLVFEQSHLDRPLFNSDELIRQQAMNHLETQSAYAMSGMYAPWIHAFRARCFLVLPHMTSRWCVGDITTACVQAQRIVQLDCLRQADGSGWMIGLQLKNKDPVSSANLCYWTMVKCAQDEGIAHHLSGHSVFMESVAVQWLMSGHAGKVEDMLQDA